MYFPTVPCLPVLKWTTVLERGASNILNTSRIFSVRIYAYIGSSIYKHQKSGERALKTVSIHICNINKKKKKKRKQKINIDTFFTSLWWWCWWWLELNKVILFFFLQKHEKQSDDRPSVRVVLVVLMTMARVQ